MVIIKVTLGLILVVGVIRVATEHPKSFWEFMGQLTLIDWLIEALGDILTDEE